MKIKHLILATFFVLLATVSFADKIYLKDGKVLDGKIRESDNYFLPSSMITENPNYVSVWNRGSSQGVLKTDILKVEKELKRPRGAALLAKDEFWGEEKYGYKTQLVPVEKEYVLGQPMRVHILLKNVSNHLKWYDAQGMYNDPLIVKKSGQEVLYKNPSAQTLGSAQPIDTGEIEIVRENYDIAENYVIDQPGIYTVQLRHNNWGLSLDSTFPFSNIVSIRVQSGKVRSDDEIIRGLTPILPDKEWEISSWGNKDTVLPFGRQNVKGRIFMIAQYGRWKSETIMINLWQTQEPSYLWQEPQDCQIQVLESKASPAQADAEYFKSVFGSVKGCREDLSEYLGRDSQGRHYYILANATALKKWPTVKMDIAKTLKLNKKEDHSLEPALHKWVREKKEYFSGAEFGSCLKYIKNNWLAIVLSLVLIFWIVSIFRRRKFLNFQGLLGQLGIFCLFIFVLMFLNWILPKISHKMDHSHEDKITNMRIAMIKRMDIIAVQKAETVANACRNFVKNNNGQFPPTVSQLQMKELICDNYSEQRVYHCEFTESSCRVDAKRINPIGKDYGFSIEITPNNLNAPFEVKPLPKEKGYRYP